MHARVKAATKGIEHAHIPGDAKEALARRQAQKAELERQLKNYEDGRPKPEAFGAGSIPLRGDHPVTAPPSSHLAFPGSPLYHFLTFRAASPGVALLP